MTTTLYYLINSDGSEVGEELYVSYDAACRDGREQNKIVMSAEFEPTGETDICEDFRPFCTALDCEERQNDYGDCEAFGEVALCADCDTVVHAETDGEVYGDKTFVCNECDQDRKKNHEYPYNEEDGTKEVN